MSLVSLVILIDLSYQAISAWATLAAAVATAIAVIIALKNWQSAVEQGQAENRQGRLALSSQLLLDLTNNFNSVDMLKKRVDSANFLLDHRQNRTIAYPEELSSTVDVLNFFEGIAGFVRIGALDKESVWQRFYIHMYMYWCLAEIHVKTDLEKAPIYWRDLQALLKEFHELNREQLWTAGYEDHERITGDDLVIYMGREAKRREKES